MEELSIKERVEKTDEIESALGLLGEYKSEFLASVFPVDLEELNEDYTDQMGKTTSLIEDARATGIISEEAYDHYRQRLEEITQQE